MSDASSRRSWLSPLPAIFSRCASRLPASMALAATLAFGASPALAQTDARVEPATAHPGPLELIKSSLSRVLTIVQSQSVRDTQEGKRRPEIRQAAADMFDFDDISRRILAQHWKNASPQEQDEFVRLFTEMLERVYLSHHDLSAGLDHVSERDHRWLVCPGPVPNDGAQWTGCACRLPLVRFRWAVGGV
jgi:MlaC protein